MVKSDRVERRLIDGFAHQLLDIDPSETGEWVDSFDAVVDSHGKTPDSC